LRYKLSLRDVAELFLARGFVFTHETVRDWEERLAPLIADHTPGDGGTGFTPGTTPSFP
jgi:transposase-like protein